MSDQKLKRRMCNECDDLSMDCDPREMIGKTVHNRCLRSGKLLCEMGPGESMNHLAESIAEEEDPNE